MLLHYTNCDNSASCFTPHTTDFIVTIQTSNYINAWKVWLVLTIKWLSLISINVKSYYQCIYSSSKRKSVMFQWWTETSRKIVTDLRDGVGEGAVIVRQQFYMEKWLIQKFTTVSHCLITVFECTVIFNEIIQIKYP